MFGRKGTGPAGLGRTHSVVLVRQDGVDHPADVEPTSWPLGPGETVVGRDEVCDVQIVDSKISRRHLVIRHDAAADVFVAIDQASANGTRINGAPLDTERLLAEGDVLELGDAALRFTGRRVTGQVRGLRAAQFGEGREGTIAGPLDEADA